MTSLLSPASQPSISILGGPPAPSGGGGGGSGGGGGAGIPLQPIAPLENLQAVSEARGLTEKKLKAATLGASQFLWLPSVGTPKVS